MSEVPVPEVAAGATLRRPSSARIWLLAARPATLPAAMSGVIVGLAMPRALSYEFRPLVALGCLAVALLLQIAANFANDLSDFRRGADTPNRVGPVRVAAAGLVTQRQLEIAIAVTLVAAGVIGLWLATIGGPFLIVLGGLAMIAALAYTGGPWPYGYKALGEVFVFIFFGLVSVVGTAYLQALWVHELFFIASIPVGSLAAAILVVNNLRDIDTDAAAGKRTLAVMIGREWTRVEYALLVGAAYAVPSGLALFVLVRGNPAGAGLLLPLISLPLAVRLIAAVRGSVEPQLLNPVLRATARLAFVHAVLFAAGLFVTIAGSAS